MQNALNLAQNVLCRNAHPLHQNSCKNHRRFVTSYHFQKKTTKLTIKEIRNKTPLQNLTWLEAPATNHTSKLTVEAGLGVEWFSTASNTPRAFPSLKLTVSPPFSHPTRKRSSSNNPFSGASCLLIIQSILKDLGSLHIPTCVPHSRTPSRIFSAWKHEHMKNSWQVCSRSLWQICIMLLWIDDFCSLQDSLKKLWDVLMPRSL